MANPTNADVLAALRTTYERLAALDAKVDQLLERRGSGGGGGGGGGQGGAKGATDKQVAFLKRLIADKGVADPLGLIKTVAGWAPESLDDLGKLSGYKASQVIDHLTKMADAAQEEPPPPDDDDVPF